MRTAIPVASLTFSRVAVEVNDKQWEGRKVAGWFWRRSRPEDARIEPFAVE